jgi:hypothetical protein
MSVKQITCSEMPTKSNMFLYHTIQDLLYFLNVFEEIMLL